MSGQGQKNLRSLRYLAVALLALLAALGFGACGGGDETASLTKAQFIKQADAICERADQEQLTDIAAVEKEIPGGRTPGRKLSRAWEERLILNGGLPAIQKEIVEVAALPAPEGDEQSVEAIVRELEAGLKTAEEKPLQALETVFIKADKLSAQYGFKVCSEAL